MKKKIILMVAFMFMAMLLTGCSSTKEYTIDEFGKLFLETEELYQDQTRYTDVENLSQEEAYDLYVKCSKKTGLPVNKKIILKGIKDNNGRNFFVSSEMNNELKVFCQSEFTADDLSIFIKKGENIAVEGIFSNKNDFLFGTLSDIKILSPKIEATYKDNIGDTLEHLLIEPYDDVLVMGEVKEIYTNVEFRQKMNNAASLLNDTDIPDSITTIYGLPDYSKGTIFVGCDKNVPPLAIGAKVAFAGYTTPILENGYSNFLKYEGDFYIFENKGTEKDFNNSSANKNNTLPEQTSIETSAEEYSNHPFNVPVDWTKKITETFDLTFTPKNDETNATLVVTSDHQTEFDLKTEQGQLALINTFQVDNTAFKILDREIINVAGETALSFSTSDILEGRERRLQCVVFPSNDAYVFFFMLEFDSAIGKYTESFNTIINSIQ